MTRRRILLLLIGSFLIPPPSSAQYVSISSDYVAAVGDVSSQGIVFGTSPLYTPPNADLSNHFIDLTIGNTESTHLVFRIDGNNYDMNDPMNPVGVTFHAVGSGLGAYLEGSHIFNNVECYARYEIVNNVLSNNRPDMFMMRFIITNHDSVGHNAACRFELDTKVNGSDGANISVDNGNNAVTVAQVWRATPGPMPPDWWDFDVDPHMGTPQVVGRGVLYSNPYGEPATMPDCFEIADWDYVSYLAQWNLGNIGMPVSADSAVVFWWTGSGDETGSGYALDPAQSVTFTTYYGLNAGVLLATDTPNPSDTATQTPTMTPIISVTSTPTWTCTPSVLPTAAWTSTPTCTVTPTWAPAPKQFLLSCNLAGPEETVKAAFCSDMGGNARMGVFNSAGELVRVLWEGRVRRGEWHHLGWDLRNQSGERVASGVYIINLTLPSGSRSRRLLVR